MSEVPLRFQVSLEGKTLQGRYRIHSEIDRGGMGTVYRAEDLGLSGVTVVVKVPLPELMVQDGFRARFADEVRDLIKLRHPRIVRILAQGEESDVPFLVLEYLGGGSLAEKLRSAPGRIQAPSEVLAWLPTVAEALDFIWQRGVVHRDVKPGNILFDENGHAYLSDFGIAKAIASGHTLTPTGFVQGSPAYMAPEQAVGTSTTGAVDQYSLATVVYEALSGNKPFAAETPLATLFRKQTTPPPDLAAVAPNVSPACVRAVARALSIEPAKRFATCEAFASAFREGCTVPVARAARVAAATEPPTSVAKSDSPLKRPGAKPKPKPKPTPNRRWVVAVVACGLVAAGVGAAALGGAFRAKRETVAFRPPVEAAVVPPPSDTTPPTLDVTDPAASPASYDTGVATIRGRAIDANLAEVRIDGKPVPFDASGAFSVPLALPESGGLDVTVEAVDRAGNRSSAVELRLERRRKVDAWAASLSGAEAAGRKKRWGEAQALLSKAKEEGVAVGAIAAWLADGVAAYAAPPTLTIEVPVEGSTTSDGRVTVRGRMHSGRPSDAVFVETRPVPVEGEEFSVTLALTAEGSKSILVEVRDGATLRASAHRTVTYRKPEEIWAKFLADWASPADEERDPVTHYPHRIARKSDGAEMVLVPAGSSSIEHSEWDMAAQKSIHHAAVGAFGAFYMDAAEVTNAQWERFVAATGHRTAVEQGAFAYDLTNVRASSLAQSGGAALGVSWRKPSSVLAGSPTWKAEPVVFLALADVLTFLRWVGAELPDEHQWLGAALAGRATPPYGWSSVPERAANLPDLDYGEKKFDGMSLANYRDGFAFLAPVRSFPANAFGLFDMDGNVTEMCRPVAGTLDPTAPVPDCMVRGGSWSSCTDRL